MNQALFPDLAPEARRRYRPFQGFVPAFSWGLRLALGRPRRLVALALVAGLVGFLVGSQGVARAAAAHGHSAGVEELWTSLDGSLLRYVVPLVTLLLVAGGFQREVSDRTLVFHLVRPISRGTLFLARFLAGALVAVPLAMVPIAVALSFCGFAVPVAVWLSLPLTVALGVLSTGAIYYLLAAWLRFGTIAGLIYTFVIDSFVQGTAGTMQRLSALYYMRSLHHSLTDDALGALSPEVRHLIARHAPTVEVPDVGPSIGSLIPDARQIDWLPADQAAWMLLAISACALLLGWGLVSRRDYALKE